MEMDVKRDDVKERREKMIEYLEGKKKKAYGERRRRRSKRGRESNGN